MSRIYLDNAATSWPKPEPVYAAVNHALRDMGAAAGRGVYRESLVASQMIDETRIAVMQMIHGSDANRVVFTHNGTAALNLAIQGVLQPGDHAICTAIDHNSVLRPLRMLAKTRGVEVTRIPCDTQGFCDPAMIQAACTKRTKLIVISHASNVTGTIQDIAAIGKIARENGVLFLLDAAQTLGHVPIDLRTTHVDLLAAPGHKGLLGPLGTGVLYVGENAQELVHPTIAGGTGTHSERDEQPFDWPVRLEAGNANVPAIAGLLAGIKWINEHGVASLHFHEQQLNLHWERLLASSGLDKQLISYGPVDPTNKVGVVSINSHDYEPSDLAVILDQQQPRIQVRAGLHCAPLIHEAIDSKKRGGTLRLSWGAMTTIDELNQFANILKTIINN